ncbi:hypothetical protein CLD22_10990 [Rubrivivax gelatinosus]|nr:hypothetical protein [Rubrivivax gelatinosus]
MVEYTLVDDLTLRSPRLGFVTLPEEWCDAQLFDAACLTLDLLDQTVAQGIDLKDASAWNILFDGAHPVFCDLLSFEPLTRKTWWAAGQFARQFILPLLLSRKVDLRASHAFRLWRDGVPSEAARAMLGPSRFLTRYWPLMASAGASFCPVKPLPPAPRDALIAHRRSLHASLRWMLDGVRPVQGDGATTWSDYEGQRAHYADASIGVKRRQVDEWLGRICPQWVADFGCNAGEFSLIAHARGARVVAVDSDHGALSRLYVRLEGRRGVHPVLATLDDIGAGRGWAGAEVPGLSERLAGRFDVVMMLALVHHLAIGAAVRLKSIAKFAHDCSRGWVIVEWLDSDDPLLCRLCEERRRDPKEFSVLRQRRAFMDAGFAIEAEQAVPETSRTLALLRKTSP